MKVIENNQRQLSLRAFSWHLCIAMIFLAVLFPGTLLYALLVGEILPAFFALAYCLILWAIGPDDFIDLVYLRLERPSQTVTVVRRTLFKTETTTFELGNLIEANIWDPTSPKAMLWHAVSYGRPIPGLVLVLTTEDPPKIYRVPGARDSESLSLIHI